MSICTAEELFDYMGTEQIIRQKKEKFINFLIKNVSNQLEEQIGRKLRKISFKNLILKNDFNCYFYKNIIYLKYFYRDIYNIDEFKLNNIIFTKYILDKNKGCLIIEGNKFLYSSLIEISGDLGLLDENEDLISELKIAGMELIAVKSRLWTRNIYTLDGTVETLVLDISKDTKDIVNKYILKNY